MFLGNGSGPTHAPPPPSAFPSELSPGLSSGLSWEAMLKTIGELVCRIKAYSKY